MSATLGGLLKDYRMQNDLSQMEVAFNLGWKEASRLSRIEQGKVGKPSRELLGKIMEAMKLNDEEKNHLLLVGNYLPTRDEIEKVRNLVNPIIQERQYPVVVYDFSWRMIHQNDANIRVFRKNKEEADWIQDNTPWIFEIEYDPELRQNRYLKGEDLEKWHNTLKSYMVQFKYVQRMRSKEKWYIDLVKKMMKNDLFRKFWKETKAEDYNRTIRAYGVVKAIPPEDESKVLTFEVVNAFLVNDPRFEVEFHFPTDFETYKYFEGK